MNVLQRRPRVVLAVAAVAVALSWPSGAAAGCAGPGVSAERTGTDVVVRGENFVIGCSDSMTCREGGGCGARCQADEEQSVVAVVRVEVLAGEEVLEVRDVRTRDHGVFEVRIAARPGASTVRASGGGLETVAEIAPSGSPTPAA